MVLSGANDAARTLEFILVSDGTQGRKPAVDWLKHAFAIDSPKQIKPNEMQRALVEEALREGGSPLACRSLAVVISRPIRETFTIFSSAVDNWCSCEPSNQIPRQQSPNPVEQP